MKRSRIVRWQILILIIVLGLMVWRLISGPPAPDGLVVLVDLKTADLAHSAFQLDGPAVMVVQAVASFEVPDRPNELATYGWMLDRASREVVWRMNAEQVHRSNGTLAEGEDSLLLGPGIYDVYYTTYGSSPSARRGSSFLGLNLDQHWENDQEAWKFIVREKTDGSPAKARLLDEPDANRYPQPEGLVWRSAPLSEEQQATYLFEVERSFSLSMYAVGHVCNDPCDQGWIEEATTGEKRWEMTLENTAPAGGAPENRSYRGEITLQAGVYRAVFLPEASGHGGWSANPPYDPTARGLTFRAEDPAVVSTFDPWTKRTPLIQMTQVGNDDLRSSQFVVKQPLRMIAYALGEVGSSKYDYAWIENRDTETKVWEMSREASQEAGGGESNRVELAFLDFSPATYTVYYQTDGSHAFGDWRNGEPSHPERWGITLFPFDQEADTSMVAVLAPSMPDAESMPPAPSPGEGPLPPAGTSTVLLDATRLENESSVEHLFSLENPTRLRLRAVGEISPSGRYDYGWIERNDNGEVVWEMTLQNTDHAGGDDRNRGFDGIISLPAGTYKAFFRTDFSHAYNDFDGGGPAMPEAWGVKIERIDG